MLHPESPPPSEDEPPEPTTPADPTPDPATIGPYRFWSDAGFRLVPIDPETLKPTVDAKAWLENAHTRDIESHLTIYPTDSIGGVIPHGMIALAAASTDSRTALTNLLKAIGVPPRLSFFVRHRQLVCFRIDDNGTREALEAGLPRGIQLARENYIIPLPTGGDFHPDRYHAKALSELSLLSSADVERLKVERARTPASPNPLREYSLRDSIADIERVAVDAKPLLGELALLGQATVIYAPPNSGKTLIMMHHVLEAIAAGRVQGDDVFYINADDTAAGLAVKGQLLADRRAHLLAPGFKGFKGEQVLSLLRKMVDTDSAKGCLVVIDTLKKVTSLMSKDESRAFAMAARDFVTKGGTLVALAHTNKAPKPDGKLQYAGTSDIMDDFDAAYIATPRGVDPDSEERLVEFENRKRRGNNVQSAAYSYPVQADSYEELLAGVRKVDSEVVAIAKQQEEQRSDAEVIEAVITCINDGIVKKMDLGAAVAARASISERSAIRLIDRYTGTDPAAHRWNYAIHERGAKVFALLPPPA